MNQRSGERQSAVPRVFDRPIGGGCRRAGILAVERRRQGSIALAYARVAVIDCGS
jgi:hypothetical protein